MKTYVDAVYKEGFAVIDVNLPRHIVDYSNNAPDHQETDDVEARTKEATDLLTYLWENYVDLNDNTHIFLMGTNTGHGAIINFIKNHEQRAKSMINKAISFVEDVALLGIKSLMGTDELPNWYYRNSQVFVANQHNYFSTEISKKSKRRFGRVYQSEATYISDMLVEHKDDVMQALLEDTEDWKEESNGNHSQLPAVRLGPPSPMIGSSGIGGQ